MKIGVDLDDVLSQSTPALIKFHNEKYGTNFDIKNLKVFKLMTILGNDKKHAEQKLHEFHTSSYGKTLPIPGVKKILEKLKKNNELYVITARGDDIKKVTLKWVNKNFPNIFSGIYLTNEFVNSKTKTNKKTVCNDLKIDIFVEDNLDYATECVSPKRKVYLLDYPWNQAKKLTKGITRVSSWEKIPF